MLHGLFSAQGRQLFFLDAGCSSLALPDPALSWEAQGLLCMQGERLVLSRISVLPVMKLVRNRDAQCSTEKAVWWDR